MENQLKEFYGLIEELENRLGGRRLLTDKSALKGISAGGVYFFFEDGENREIFGLRIS